MEESKGNVAGAATGGDGLATSGRWWVTEPNGIAPERPSAPGDNSPRLTVMEVFRNTVKEFAHKPALNWMELPDVSGAELDKAIARGTWHSWTWRQYYDECMAFARSLVAIDFAPFATVNILGFNHRNWLVADLGCIAAGGMAAGIYTTNAPEAVAYIVDHSECQVAVVENKMQLEKFATLLDSDMASNLKAIVVYDDVVDPVLKESFEAKRAGFKVYSWDEFMALGKGEDMHLYKARVESRIAAQLPGHCCTLIYTSGTTGPPKAVMVSHDNVTWTAGTVLKESFALTDDDRLVSYLPLSHIAAQMLDVHGPMVAGAQVYFSTISAFKGQLKAWLNACEPTIFFGVPRVWEKMEAAIKAIAKSRPAATGIKKKLIDWAKRCGATMSENVQYGRSGNQPFMYGLAYKLVLSKIHGAIGLSKARVLATGAAPIGKATLAFFANLSMPIYEVFGQSECTGPQTVNYPDPAGFAGMYKLGTAGPAVKGSVMAVVPDPVNKPLKRVATGEGEVVYSGRHIMMGYMKNPKKTREAIDSHGFLHSGDKGLIDKDGFLRITGRYKELIIGAGGENIAPVLIEQTFKEECPAISNFVVYGDQQKFLVALVTLQCVEDPETRRPTDNLAAITIEHGKKWGCTATTASGAVATDDERNRWMAGLEEVRKAANAKAVSRASHVQIVHILQKDFEVGDELTDTMKLKRAVVYKKYMEDIKAMYQSKNAWRDVE